MDGVFQHGTPSTFDCDDDMYKLHRNTKRNDKYIQKHKINVFSWGQVIGGTYQVIAIMFATLKFAVLKPKIFVIPIQVVGWFELGLYLMIFSMLVFKLGHWLMIFSILVFFWPKMEFYVHWMAAHAEIDVLVGIFEP